MFSPYSARQIQHTIVYPQRATRRTKVSEQEKTRVHRSTLLYIGMLVLLGGGLEGIRRVGNTLTPPRQIAGAWRLTVSPSSSSCPLLEFGEAGDDNLQVEQSGRYLTLTFTDVHHTRLRARFDGRELYGGGLSTSSCAAGKWVHVTGRLNSDHLELILTRPQETPVPTLVLSGTQASGLALRSPASP